MAGKAHGHAFPALPIDRLFVRIGERAVDKNISAECLDQLRSEG